MRETLPLRLNTVFISANLRNIEVFRAIADHDLSPPQRGVPYWYVVACQDSKCALKGPRVQGE